jgi:hypothetical protein
MDNVQNYDSYNNIPSSQTYRYYCYCWVLLPLSYHICLWFEIPTMVKIFYVIVNLTSIYEPIV